MFWITPSRTNAWKIRPRSGSADLGREYCNDYADIGITIGLRLMVPHKKFAGELADEALHLQSEQRD